MGDKIKQWGCEKKQCKCYGSSENGNADRKQAGIRVGLMGSPVSVQNVNAVQSGKQNDHDTKDCQDQNGGSTISVD